MLINLTFHILEKGRLFRMHWDMLGCILEASFPVRLLTLAEVLWVISYNFIKVFFNFYERRELKANHNFKSYPLSSISDR